MPTQARMKVFVIDDELIIAGTLTAILSTSGIDAIPYTNPIAALEAVESLKPDLVITDVAMPELNGVDLAIKIKTILPKCKILLFSGHAATSSLLDAARSKGHDFTLLTKPIHPRDLLAAINVIGQ